MSGANLYEVANAHPLSVFIVVVSCLGAPLYLFSTYIWSGSSARQGLKLGTTVAMLGALMFLVCITTLPRRLGAPGPAIIPLAWCLPSVLLVRWRHRLLADPLSQHWLVGLQVFRMIGGIFLLEMGRGNVPAVFAYPAGLGDILVGLVALWTVWHYRRRAIPRKAILLVAGLGFLDFAIAIFFGFTSGETLMQLFPQETPSRLLLFPSGMIPLFLVPFAIFFHTLSLLTLKHFGVLDVRSRIPEA